MTVDKEDLPGKRRDKRTFSNNNSFKTKLTKIM